MKDTVEIEALRNVLNNLRNEGKILLAYLYGSYAIAQQHKHSDIDLAIYLDTRDEEEAIEIIDAILMTTEKTVEILRLDDEDESPFMIQEAIKGVPLVDPDMETLYSVAHKALHEAEGIRYRRQLPKKQNDYGRENQ